MKFSRSILPAVIAINATILLSSWITNGSRWNEFHDSRGIAASASSPTPLWAAAVSLEGGGSTFYIATNGDDANPGTLERPFKTLQRAVPLLKPAMTLLVRGGEYDTVNGLQNGGNSIIPSGTSWDSAVTIKAYPGEKPVFRRYVPPGSRYTEEQIRSGAHMPTRAECEAQPGWQKTWSYPNDCWAGGAAPNSLQEQFTYGSVPGYVLQMDNDESKLVQYVIFDGIDFDARGITNGLHFYSGARHIRLQNGEIRLSLRSCVVQQTSDGKILTDLQFINMKIHSCGVPYDTNMIGAIPARKHPSARFRHPWYMQTGGNSLINSEVYNSAGTGLGPAGDKNIIRGNFIHDNTVQGIYIVGNDWIIENNVFYNNGGIEIYQGSGGTHKIRKNTVVAGPRYLDGTNTSSWGVFINTGAHSAVYEDNIIVGFKYGIWNQSTAKPAVTARNNWIVSANPDREIYDAYPGVTPVVRLNNTFKQDPKLGPAPHFTPQSGSPVIAKASDGGNLGAK